MTRTRPPVRRPTKARLRPSDGPLFDLVDAHRAFVRLDREHGPDGYDVTVALARWRQDKQGETK